MYYGRKLYPKQSPLKKELKRQKIAYWQLREALGLSEFKISRMLNGIEPMPQEVEQEIKRILALSDEWAEQHFKKEVEQILA